MDLCAQVTPHLVNKLAGTKSHAALDRVTCKRPQVVYNRHFLVFLRGKSDSSVVYNYFVLSFINDYDRVMDQIFPDSYIFFYILSGVTTFLTPHVAPSNLSYPHLSLDFWHNFFFLFAAKNWNYSMFFFGSVN